MYKDIAEQVKEVIAYSQSISLADLQVEKLVETWAKNKQRFINTFGEKLIYEVGTPVTFHLDDESKVARLKEFENFVYDNCNNYPLYDFLRNCEDDFYNNKTSDVVNISTLDGFITVPKDMKIIKAFKFFEKDKKVLRKLQDMASRLIQENYVTGTLCFSVHPLDYLSSSLNNYNWRSCHALDGDYRAGNLSYMTDETTIICYLKGTDGVRIPLFPENIPWNDKKWRMLIHLDKTNDIVFCGRPYPFGGGSEIQTVLRLLAIALKKDFNAYDNARNYRFHYIDDNNTDFLYTLNDDYVVLNGNCVALNDIIREGAKCPLHYNDLLKSSCYFPYYIDALENKFWCYNRGKTDPLYIGNDVLCLHCGKSYISETDAFFCEDCNYQLGYEEFDGCYCENCDCRILDGDDIWVDGSECTVCPDCYYNETSDCEACGKRFFNDELYSIPEKDGLICEYCKEQLTREEE